jgi:DNA repair protein RadA/Sms
MIKTKIAFGCTACGAVTSKWQGQCVDCGEWNTLTEFIEPKTPNPHMAMTLTMGAMANANDGAGSNQLGNGPNFSGSGYSGSVLNQITQLRDITIQAESRLPTQQPELDRVLGGGIVMGSVMLIGGDPGIGKSTLLLQTLTALAQTHKALYVTGEESLQQVKLRAARLNLDDANADLLLLTETNIEQILLMVQRERPKIMVLDSIQTMYTLLVQSAPGSVAQVRECCAQIVRFAKQQNIAIFLVGHVTKEGAIAGPRVLEHMVDTVLYFEGDVDNKFRLIRAYKNRFGSVNELGIFAMTEAGLKGVTNPSAIFLARNRAIKPGSVVMATREGTRSMLLEIQALVDESHLNNPRRVAVGIEPNRLAMLLAIMHRHVGVVTYNQDIFINVVGGVKISETAIDVPVVVAIYSSLNNRAIPTDIVFFGEVGLSGEVRPVQNGQDRLKEAEKLGFKRAIVPKDNAPKDNAAKNHVQKHHNNAEESGTIKIFPITNVNELMQILRNELELVGTCCIKL